MKGKPAKPGAAGGAPRPESDGRRPRGASPAWGSVEFVLKRRVSPHGQVTAVSMMKDEGPFVLEWVAHHLALGFTDLVVYTNDCSDGTDDMLIRLEQLGLAHHRRNVIAPGLRPQPSALNHAQDEPVVRQSDWVMVFDADEFLSIRHGDGGLDGLIAAATAQGANGIVVTWRIFGSGGVVDWSRAPVTEQYLMAAPTSWNKGWGVKTLFQFSPEHWKLGIHRPKMKTKWIKTDFPDQVKWLNGSGRVMEEYFKFRGWRSITRTVGHDWVQLNHYAVKSIDSYAIRKLRGNVNFKKDKYNSDYWALQDRNEVRDETMLRYSEARNSVIATLLTDPILHRLHHAALGRAEARLAEIKAGADYRQLVEDLAAASRKPLAEIVAKPPQARDKAKIAAQMSEIEKARVARAKADRKGLAEPPDAPALPAAHYATSGRAQADAANLAWHDNHGLLLPADGGILPEGALGLVRSGKFERALARRLPQWLAKGATVVEIGSAMGFQALHLARARPDLTIWMQEQDAALRLTLERVMARNALAPGPALRLAEPARGSTAALAAAQALVALARPRALLLADARLGPEDLALLIAAQGTALKQVFLYGRWLQTWHAQADRTAALLETQGLTPAHAFDAATALAFARAKPRAPAKPMPPRAPQEAS